MIKLNKSNQTKITKKILLIILDGVGYTEKKADFGNAIDKADMPALKKLWAEHPCVQIQAHGKAVGMPSDEDMGNSEVGHNVLGSGRIFDQGAKLVSQSIESGELFEGKTWLDLIENVKKNSSTLHFLGLFSDGNVHSHLNHLTSLIRHSKKDGVKKVRIHALLDGRDVPEKSALDYIEPFEKFLAEIRTNDFDIQFASGGGRMSITMDRYEADWKMVERGWRVHVLGEGRKFHSIKEAIETFRKEDPKVIDQYLPEFVISDLDKNPVGKILKNDSVVFFNFRGDRAIEISQAFSNEKFDKFDRVEFPKVHYAGIMQYDGDLKIPENYLVPPPAIDKTLSEYLISEKIKEYAVSETQKFGHVTFFWNGNKSGYLNKNFETYTEIPSDIIPFDEAPKMKAIEITEDLIKVMKSNEYEFIRVNYPNGDMVGHTGNFDATVKSLEFLDSCIAKLISTADETDYTLLITADHGNADEMFQLDKKGNVQFQNGIPVPKTSHTLNPVNFLIYDKKNRFSLEKKENAGLANIAGTILDLMGYELPESYHASLLKRN
jgi:2,3-bisphosphoglycerate-independent phosphoglycerate mutase